MKTNRRYLLKSGATTFCDHLLTAPKEFIRPDEKANPNFRSGMAGLNNQHGWTFNPMPTLELASLCKEIGLVAMEGISPKYYPKIKELGLDISLVGSHGFKKGPVDPANHDECVQKIKQSIELCASAGYKRVITFTGMKTEGINDDRRKKLYYLLKVSFCREEKITFA